MRYSILFLCIVGILTITVLVHEGIHLLHHEEIKERKICLFDQGKLAYVDFGDIVLYEKGDDAQLEDEIATLGGLVAGLTGCVFLAKNKDCLTTK